MIIFLKGDLRHWRQEKDLFDCMMFYYPPGTKFRHKADEQKGMKSYRDICRLIDNNTLECTTEQLDFGQWKPWGKGEPYRLTRKPASGKAIPKWLLEDWAERTQNEGIWITDNSKYKSEQEPYDAYGMQWEYGLGEKHLKGQLYCMKDGKDVGTIWQFTEFWDPHTEKVKVVQIGSNGTVGQGKIWLEKDGKKKEQQTFISPGGGSFKTGHLAWSERDELHTQSYNIIKGKWEKRRYYVWKLQSESETKSDIPKVYQPLTFLIGEWSSGFGDGRGAKMQFAWAENQRMIKFKNSYRKAKDAPFETESEGLITYHGVKDQLVFMNTYMSKKTHLISEGRYEIDEKGTIHRIFTCHYKEGDRLPWSEGAMAPKGGKSIDFKQIWIPVDADTFKGDFYWKKNGKWEHPIKDYDKKDFEEIWRRVKG